MPNVQLRVNPEELKNISIRIEDQAARVRSNLQSIKDTMSQTGSYWYGDAAEADRSEFTGLREEMDTLISSLINQPQKLRQIAGIMESTEGNNVILANGLSKELDIVLDIEEAGKKAQELENLASQLEKISDTELDEILTSIQNAWKGDNATAFIKKGTTLAGNINTSAGQLRRIAETIRTIAKNLQAADAQAAATASKI